MKTPFEIKHRRSVILGIAAVLVMAVAVAASAAHRQQVGRKQIVTALKHLPAERIESAAKSFAREQKVLGNTVQLADLLAAGYIRSEDARGLEGKDVAISLTASEETPDEVLVRVREPGRRDIVLRADGAITW